MSPSRALVAVLPCLLLVGAPAAAQDRAAFAEATIQFVQAAEGEFGDEGRYVLAAVEAMARALAGWDAALSAAESAMAADAAGRPPHSTPRGSA